MTPPGRLLLATTPLAVALGAPHVVLAAGTGQPGPHPHGWLSLAPPLVAIALAVSLRRVLVALAGGVFTGALVLAEFDPLAAAASSLEGLLWPALKDEGHLRVIAFTLLMGAMVGVVSRSGGMQGLVNLLVPLARGRRGGQLVTWVLGLVVFFDDYANTVLLGNTLRPVTDRLRISRQKLAYLVDSTAAPVAGLAFVSTWIATEVSFIADGLRDADLPGDAYAIFLATIPYRFYVLWGLGFVALVALLARDFGPMLRAERQALAALPESVRSRLELDEALVPPGHIPHRAVNAVVPVAVVVAGVLGLLYATGINALRGDEAAPPTWRTILGHSDSYLAMLYGSLAGLVVAVLLARAQTLLSWPELQHAAGVGARTMLPGLAVLVLAWALSAVTQKDHLDTGGYVGGLLKQQIPLWLLPTLVFVLSSAIAFATGTSWGTMGLMVPLSISTTVGMLAAGQATADHPLLLATVGSVLAGAVFGDHCSPISDTTVLSSQASGCPHLEHVETQLPYAALVGLVAVVCGTLPAGFDLPLAALHAAGGLTLLAALLLLGRRPATQ